MKAQLRKIHALLGDSGLLYASLAEGGALARDRALIESICSERRGMMAALVHEAALDGEELEPAASVGGLLNDIRVRVRDAIGHPAAAEVLGELERGERHLRDLYDEGIAAAGPGRLKQVLVGQRNSIDRNVRALHEAIAAHV
ncbi:MAG: hypothetical protein IT228_11280 [Flavobacteriales bacterium]|nr:hypothetical protein [Flavobacteriales bacterium]MCC6577914.1 hypothetical protein [Flavobacteriales bacterium]NUQ14103.1 hypothetical protein [Flavobacteriales bacterium]